jgi:hypothetical protein
MNPVIGLSALVAALLVGCSSMPGSAPKDTDPHAGHHPQGAAPTTQAPAGYEQQMKTMQEMHRKMAAARTPGERAALMKDHMKAMHDGMGMMGQMRGGMMDGKGMGSGKGAMPADPATMQRRMDMMEMMMQMMMDREGVKPPASR